MAYRIAGIDVHKKMLAVVICDVEVDGEFEFERRRCGSNPEQLRLLVEWLIDQQVEEIVMESTAQYWKPVWGALERYWKPICQKREGAGPMSGNRHKRRILNQTANAAAKSKGTVFEIVYRRLTPRLGHNQTIGAIAHRLCRLIWIILHEGVRYEERGPSVSAISKRRRTNRMIRELRGLGYRVEPLVTTV